MSGDLGRYSMHQFRVDQLPQIELMVKPWYVEGKGFYFQAQSRVTMGPYLSIQAACSAYEAEAARVPLFHHPV